MTNKAAAFATLNTFADSRTALIKGMQDAGYKTLEACKPIVIEWACNKTGAEYRETKAGKVVLVSDHAKYEAAKTTVRDIMLMLQGTTRHAVSARKENDPITALAAKLAKLSKADQRKVLALAGL
jgi:hypothetical protein